MSKPDTRIQLVRWYSRNTKGHNTDSEYYGRDAANKEHFVATLDRADAEARLQQIKTGNDTQFTWRA